MKNIKLSFLLQFAIDDFKTKYAGSLFGFIWAFIQPVITVIIYWFVFQVGFGSQPVNGIPFIVWLISGLLPWFYVSDALSNATSSLVEYGYLVKKVVFNIDILPLVRIISTMMIQLFLMLVAAILALAYGTPISVYWIQIVYYMVYMLVICTGISYFTSAMYVFFKDTAQFIAIILQVVFWGTPIVWQMDIMPQSVQKILVYNPLFYVTNGYRDAMVNCRWFWSYGLNMNIYYWIVAIVMFVLGLFVFKRLKPHFADVL